MKTIIDETYIQAFADNKFIFVVCNENKKYILANVFTLKLNDQHPL